MTTKEKMDWVMKVIVPEGYRLNWPYRFIVWIAIKLGWSKEMVVNLFYGEKYTSDEVREEISRSDTRMGKLIRWLSK